MSVCVTLVVSMTRLSDQSKGTFFALSLYCWSVWSLTKLEILIIQLIVYTVHCSGEIILV